jgi:hypothetical protein
MPQAIQGSAHEESIVKGICEKFGRRYFFLAMIPEITGACR